MQAYCVVALLTTQSNENRTRLLMPEMLHLPKVEENGPISGKERSTASPQAVRHMFSTKTASVHVKCSLLLFRESADKRCALRSSSHVSITNFRLNAWLKLLHKSRARENLYPGGLPEQRPGRGAGSPPPFRLH